jgi:glycosyltransferase involved in cell wall biosynthesis
MNGADRSLRIGMVLDNRFPPDERVEKESLSLIAAGFEVFLLCFSFGKSAAEENYKSIQIRRVYMPQNLYKKLSALILTVPFYRWFWYRKIKRFVKLEEIDCLHIHDLPLCGVAIRIKKRFGIRVVLDMHEDWADWIVSTRHYNTCFGRMVKKFSNWENYQKHCLFMADKILVVSKKIRSKYIIKYTLNESRIINLPNTPDLIKFEIDNIDKSIEYLFSGKFTMIYVGVIDYLRGLQNIILHLPELIERISSLQLIIVGSGGFVEVLMETVKELNLQERVLFTGWMPPKMVASYIYFSQVGLYPQLKYSGIDDTIPTKLYEYCMMGIPVVSSDHKMPVEFIMKYNCGFFVDFQKGFKEFHDIILELYTNPLLAKHLGNNGRKTIVEKYNWDKTSQPLLNMYRKIKQNSIST